MPVPNFITKLFSGKASSVIDSVKGVFDEFNLSKEEKIKLEQEMIKATNEHLEKMAGIAQSELESYLKDVQSARSMQIEALKQDDSFSKRFVPFLAIGVITLTFIFDMCFFFIQYPERNHDIVNMISGTLNSTGFAAIIYFFFGSSQSSKANGDAMRKMLDK